MEPAPFDHELSEGPATVWTRWVHADDGVRLRVSFWPALKPRGTILIFPGRTEYVEKYGRVARDLVARGYSVAAVDWRGQGRSDRVFDDPRLGHVNHFLDYQMDVAAYMACVQSEDMPARHFALAHSMGGAIVLRAMIEGLSLERVVFSAPMWGIYAPPHVKSYAIPLLFFASRLNQAHRPVPGTQIEGHVTGTPFEDNKLTTDAEHYDYISRQSRSDPALSLGGPTMHWLREARSEITRLQAAPKPDVPVRVFVGSQEEIVDIRMIRSMVKRWPSAELTVYDSGRHELMMEAETIRDRFINETLTFFDAA